MWLNVTPVIGWKCKQKAYQSEDSWTHLYMDRTKRKGTWWHRASFEKTESKVSELSFSQIACSNQSFLMIQLLDFFVFLRPRKSNLVEEWLQYCMLLLKCPLSLSYPITAEARGIYSCQDGGSLWAANYQLRPPVSFTITCLPGTKLGTIIKCPVSHQTVCGSISRGFTNWTVANG